MKIKVDLFDENDYKKPGKPDDVQLTTSDVTLATVSPGTFEVVATSKDKTGVVTITAIHKDTGVFGNVELPIVGQPALIKEDVSVSDLTADVTLQFVDADGNKTWDEMEEATSLTVVAPSGVTTSEKKNFAEKTGKASFKAVADEYGTYEFTAVAANGLAKTFNVTFAEVTEPDVSQVKMFIGSKGYMKDGKLHDMDVAPFIENDRTFVPVRFIAEAFGLDPDDDIDWEPKEGATEYVYFYLEDATVTITIGSDTILVEYDDGEVAEIEMDVEAFIREDRTFLPLRFCAYALGLGEDDIDWGPKVGATAWVSFNFDQ